MTEPIKYRARGETARPHRLFIRVSAEEKSEISRLAQAAGYQSVSAYLIDAVLGSANKSAHTA